MLANVIGAPPPAGIFFIALLPKSATYTLPAASTATLVGFWKPKPKVTVVRVPSGISFTALLPPSATNTSPAASTATPFGEINPEPTGTGPPPPAGIL